MTVLGESLWVLVGSALPWLDATAAPNTEPVGEIVWQAPAECTTARAIRADVERLLGDGHATLAGVQGHGTVTRTTDGRWSVELRVVTPQGLSTRQLSSDRCETLAEAAALYIAMAVDPIAVLETDPFDEPAPMLPVDDRPADPAALSPATATTRPSPAAKHPRTGVGVRAFGVGGLGLMPRLGGGFGAGATLIRPWLRLELSGTYWLATTAAAPVPGVYARLRHGYAELRACPYRGRTLQLSACAGLDVGGIEARGGGVQSPSTAREPWVGVVTGVGAHWWMVPRIALAVQADAVSSLWRPRFVVDGLGEVMRVGPIAGRVTFALELRAL